MKKITILLLIITFWSCGKDDIVSPKIPQVFDVDEIISAGSKLIITGKDLDDSPTIIFNEKIIAPLSTTNSEITITIPENASSGKLKIKFEQEAYNTEKFLKVLDKGWNVFEASNYFQIKFVSDHVGFAKKSESGKNIIDKTIDGGKTWSSILEELSPTGNLAVVSNQVVFIRTTSNNIKKTTDGGATWQDIKVLDLSYIIDKLYFENAQKGFIVAQKLGKSHVFKTIDGGNTWNEVLQIDTPTYKIEIVYQKEDTILLLDRENNKFIKTEDAGINWSTTNSNFVSPYPITHNFITQHTAWLYLKRFFDKGYELFNTTDQGNTWKSIEFPKLAETIVKITFFNELNGHLLTDKGSSLYTSDGGETWKHYHIDSEYITAATTFENTLYIIANGKLLTKKIIPKS